MNVPLQSCPLDAGCVRLFPQRQFLIKLIGQTVECGLVLSNGNRGGRYACSLLFLNLGNTRLFEL